jgi:hypothetical protein
MKLLCDAEVAKVYAKLEAYLAKIAIAKANEAYTAEHYDQLNTDIAKIML